MINPGSWRRGLRSFPFSGTGKILSNGLELKSINNKKKRSKIPITDNISIIIIFDIFFENKIMLEHHSDKTNTHSKIEPSWAPQTAENL